MSKPAGFAPTLATERIVCPVLLNSVTVAVEPESTYTALPSAAAAMSTGLVLEDTIHWVVEVRNFPLHAMYGAQVTTVAEVRCPGD